MFKRVGVAVAVGVLIIGTSIFFRAPDPETQGGDAIVATEAHTYQQTKDSDGDGVPDWEENLNGTDPHKKDTSTTTLAKSDAASTEPQTMTAQFAKQFFGEYIAKNSGDTPMTDSEKQSFLQKSLQKIYTSSPVEKVLTDKDISIGAQSDVETLRAYGNAVADILNRYPVKSDNEAIILKRALDSDSEEELKKLDPIVLSYQKTIADLRAQPVPQPLIQEHLNLLNALSNVRSIIISMRGALLDPLPALSRFQGYGATIDSLRGSLIALNKSFQAKGVVFTQGEKGHFFLEI